LGAFSSVLQIYASYFFSKHSFTVRTCNDVISLEKINLEKLGPLILLVTYFINKLCVREKVLKKPVSLP